jgi:hypothetical protein
MKSIALERHFLLTFYCCKQKIRRTENVRRAGWQYALAHALTIFNVLEARFAPSSMWFLSQILSSQLLFFYS